MIKPNPPQSRRWPGANEQQRLQSACALARSAAIGGSRVQKSWGTRDSGIAPGDDGANENDVLVLSDPLPDGAKRAAPAPAPPAIGLFKPAKIRCASHNQRRRLFCERLSAAFCRRAVRAAPLQGRVVEHREKGCGCRASRLVVVDIGKGDALDINALERLKKTHFLKVPIVAISSHLDPAIARGLMRAKLTTGCRPAVRRANFRGLAKRSFSGGRQKERAAR